MQHFGTPAGEQRAILERGGVQGALAGAFLGGSREAAGGYGTVQQLRAGEQAIRRGDVDIEGARIGNMARVADLRAKALELQQQELDLDVRKLQQRGFEATAQLASDRAVNLYKHTAAYQGMDDDQIRNQTLQSIANASNEELEFVNRFAGSPYVQTREGYEVLKRNAERAGLNLGNLNLPEEWSEDTALQWRATGSMANSARQAEAAQAALESERSHEITVEALKGDQDIAQVGLELESRERIAVLNAEVNREKANASRAASRGDVDVRSLGLESYQDSQIKNINILQTSIPEWNEVGAEPRVGSDIYKANEWMTSTVEGILRRSAVNYNQGLTNEVPPTYTEVAAEVVPQVVSRIGLDGKFYENPKAPELVKDKNSFIQAVKTKPNADVRASLGRINSRYEGEQREQITQRYFNMLWSSANPRGLATGSESYAENGRQEEPVQQLLERETSF